MRQAYQPGQIPKYFRDLKEGFIQKAQEMGLDLFQVQDFVENKGLCEL